MDEKTFPNQSETLGVDLRQYLALLRHWAWLLVLGTILAGATAFIVSKQMTPIYQASTTILIDEPPSAKISDYTALLMSERRVLTYSELMTQEPVLEAVLERLGLEAKMNVGTLKGAVTVQPVRDTQLIEIRIEDSDPTRAAEIANALVVVFTERNQALQGERYGASKESLAAQLADIDQQIEEVSQAIEGLGSDDKVEKDRLEIRLEQRQELYASLLQSYEQVRLAEAQSVSNVVHVRPATRSQAPVRPRVMMNTALAAAVGLMLAVGVVFLIEALDDTVKSPDEITCHLGLPVLGFIAFHKIEEGRPISQGEPRSPVAEGVRKLGTNLKYVSPDQALKTLLVTSAAPRDGKTTVAANLGTVLAQRGHRVLLVDADLRRAQLHIQLGLPFVEGLSEMFLGEGEASLDGNLRQTQIKNLSLLGSGEKPFFPTTLLGSEKMKEILEAAKKGADIVVIDSPPVTVVTDAVILAPWVDGVLLVVRPGATKLVALKETVEELRRGGANLLGVVLNGLNPRSRYYYDYPYYSQDYYQESGGEMARVSWVWIVIMVMAVLTLFLAGLFLPQIRNIIIK